MNRMTEERTAMETHIQTIGWAMFWQGALRWAALLLMLWLALSYVDSWISAAIKAFV